MGRPLLESEPCRVDLHVRVTVAHMARLEAVARAMGLPLSSLIRAALNDYFEDMGDRRPFLGTTTLSR